MIIIGYPGIGKSSISGKENSVIDLESSNFHDKDQPQNWQETYCKVALDLSRQGFIVCISSHQSVYSELARICAPLDNDDEIIFFYPAPNEEMREKWIERLKTRYYESRKIDSNPHSVIEKNYRAWKHVEHHFYEDIEGIENITHFNVPIKNLFFKYRIMSMDYDLKHMIKSSKEHIFGTKCQAINFKEESENG